MAHETTLDDLAITQFIRANMALQVHGSYRAIGLIDFFDCTAFDEKLCAIDCNLASVLLAISNFDHDFRNIVSTSAQIYILGWPAVKSLVKFYTSIDIEEHTLRLIVMALHNVGLIYRLPCARKFGYNPFEVPQIRVSSWGSVVVRRLIEKGVMQARGVSIDLVLQKWTVQYEELVNACKAECRPLDIKLISDLNEVVMVPIVT